MSVIASQDVHVDTAKGRLYARRWDPAGAAGAPIVLFHDSLGCVALWRDFPEQLASETGRSVVAYDRLGFGLSDPNPATLVRGFIEEEADGDFARLRDALDIGPFVAFGHSVGGGMAVNVAARHASDCRALITESAQAFAEDRTVAGVADAKRGFAEPGQLDRLKKYHGEKAAWVLGACRQLALARIHRLDPGRGIAPGALPGAGAAWGSGRVWLARAPRAHRRADGRPSSAAGELRPRTAPRAKPRGAGRGGAVAQGARLSAGARVRCRCPVL